MALELVRMRHPKLEHDNGELPVTTRQAFDTVWKAKGWQLDENAPVPLVGASEDDEPAPGEQSAATSGSSRSRTKG